MTLLEYTRQQELAQARKDSAKYRERINSTPEKREEYLRKKREEWKPTHKSLEKKRKHEREKYDKLKRQDVEEYKRLLAAHKANSHAQNIASHKSAIHHYLPWEDRVSYRNILKQEKPDRDIAKDTGRTVFAIWNKRRELKNKLHTDDISKLKGE